MFARPARAPRYGHGVDIHRLGQGDEDRVIGAAHLFDAPPTAEWTLLFLAREGHHLLVAADGGEDVGFVTGVETVHPDKGAEMFVYELGVDDHHRGRGIGRALVQALAEVARERGCYGMWVLTDTDNHAALATYQSAGSSPPRPQVMLDWELRPQT